MSAPQLPLALSPPRRPRFANFIAGDNGLIVRTLRDGLEPGQWVRVSGPVGSGRSHLALATVAGLAETLAAGIGTKPALIFYGSLAGTHGND